MIRARFLRFIFGDLGSGRNKLGLSLGYNDVCPRSKTLPIEYLYLRYPTS